MRRLAIRRAVAAAAVLVAAALSPVCGRADILHARLDRMDRTYEVHADKTFVETTDVDFSLFTPRGLHERERSTKSFYPATQSLDVVEAWTEQPDGSRIPVATSGIFTRPSEATENAPGFSSSQTTTVLYPQLRPGSRTHIRWRLTQKTPALLGFNVWAQPPLEFPVGVGQVTILAPNDLPLYWRARGGFQVAETTAGATRVIRARITGTHAEEAERDMVASSDFQPLFLATTLPSLEAIGATYWQQSHDRAEVTPQIAALAHELAGGRDGEAAARAIYNWVTKNIRYVAVYMDPNDGWVPHRAADVLRAGYGDCKDHVVLMQALLAAIGMRAQAAVIDWGDQTTTAPLWVPQFNHAIVYLPDLDRFVNPTDPYAPFDSLDRNLSGKTVVLATQDGRVTRTPASRPQDNATRIEATLTLDSDGTIEGSSRTVLSPNMESRVRAMVARASSPSELAERLLVGTPEGGFGAFHTSDPRDLANPFDVVATWRSPHAAAFHAGVAVLPVPEGPDVDPLLRLRSLLLPGPRQHPVLAGARDNHWTARLLLPPGVSVGHLPSPVSLHNAAGFYTAEYAEEPHAIRVERHLVIARDVYQPSEAAALEDLIYTAIDDARDQITLLRADTRAEMP